MSCEIDSVTLNAYLDGELPAPKADSMGKHVSGCPRCAAELAEILRLQRSLRSARGHFVPSADFRRKIQQQVAVRPRRPWLLRLMPVGVALAAVLLLAIGWLGLSHRSNDYAEIADLHINALASTNPVDVVSTDRHTVKPWFQGKIPFSFNLPEFAGTDYTLIGGRMVYLHQAPGAQLIVMVRQHKMSVFIFQETAETAEAFAGEPGLTHRNQFGMETWQAQGLRFVVVSDADSAGIERLAKAFQAVNQ